MPIKTEILPDGRAYVIGQDCITPNGVGIVLRVGEDNDVWVRLKASNIESFYDYKNVTFVQFNITY